MSLLDFYLGPHYKVAQRLDYPTLLFKFVHGGTAYVTEKSEFKNIINKKTKKEVRIRDKEFERYLEHTATFNPSWLTYRKNGKELPDEGKQRTNSFYKINSIRVNNSMNE